MRPCYMKESLETYGKVVLCSWENPSALKLQDWNCSVKIEALNVGRLSWINKSKLWLILSPQWQSLGLKVKQKYVVIIWFSTPVLLRPRCCSLDMVLFVLVRPHCPHRGLLPSSPSLIFPWSGLSAKMRSTSVKNTKPVNLKIRRVSFMSALQKKRGKRKNP